MRVDLAEPETVLRMRKTINSCFDLIGGDARLRCRIQTSRYVC